MPHNSSAKHRRRAEAPPLPPGLREGLEERAGAKAAFVAEVQAELREHEDLHRTTTAKIAEVEEFDRQWGEHFEANGGRFGLLTGEKAERRRRELDVYHRKRADLIERLGLTIGACLEAEPTDEPKPNPRLTVMLTPPQAVLDGQPLALTQDGAEFLQALLEVKGDWVAGPSIAMRADRVKKRLPKQIGDMIEAQGGKGYRLRLT